MWVVVNVNYDQRSVNLIATYIRSTIDLSQNDNSNFANNIGSLFQEYDSDSDNLETVLPVNEVVDDDVC